MRPLLAALAFPWFVHAAVVLLSAIGAHPLSGRLPALATVVLSVVATVALVRIVPARRGEHAAFSRNDPGGAGASLEATPHRLAFVLWAGGVLAFVGSLAAAVVLPIVAYDAVSYRLPTIASWLDAGRIAWIVTDDAVRNGYPLGQEAVSAVFTAATGSLRLAAVTSFLHVVAGAIALWFAAESAGVRPALARASAGLFLLVPMVLLNAPSGYVDAAFGGAMVALVCIAATLAASPRIDVFASLATGMAAAHVLSLKGNGVAFVGIVGLGLAVCLARRKGGFRCLFIAVACALPGAFWVIRNIVETGNPLWPIQIVVAKRTLFPGVATMESVIDVAHNTPPAFRKLSEGGRILRTWFETSGPARDFDDRMAGLGWVWSLAAFPAVCVSAVRAVRDLRVRPKEPATWFVVFVLVATGACFALQPMRWWARYTLWLWGAGGLALATGAERLARAGRMRALTAGLAFVTFVALGEGGYAVIHANGANLALGQSRSLAELSDPRKGLNAQHWVTSSFWGLDVVRAPEICRGAWKPGTDDANLDGVFAQLVPRVPVHVVFDDEVDWSTVRTEWERFGCSALILLDGSPVLNAAGRDPLVKVTPELAFGTIHVVTRP